MNTLYVWLCESRDITWASSHMTLHECEESCDVTWAWRVMRHHVIMKSHVTSHDHDESCDVTWAWRVMRHHRIMKSHVTSHEHQVIWRYMSVKSHVTSHEHEGCCSMCLWCSWLTTLWQARNTYSSKVFPTQKSRTYSLCCLSLVIYLLGYWTCSAHCCKQLHFWEKF